MNWIRENKFLSGFIAVMVIAIGGLGYLLWSAYSDYSAATDQYNSTADTLHQLQARVPFPSEENLTKYKEQRDQYVQAAHNLAGSLSQMTLPIEDMTPSGFQDKLREDVIAITAKAAKDGVKLPDHFAFDFDNYQSEQPVPAAAAPLGRQLAALQTALNIILDDRIDGVSSLTRVRLASEGASAASRNTTFGGIGRPAVAGGGGSVEKFPFDLKFTASQNAFNKVMNDLASSNKQFFITRTLVIANSAPNAISKDAAATPAADAGAGGANFLKFLVGTEKLNVAMRIDIVAFNSPEPSGASKGGARAH